MGRSALWDRGVRGMEECYRDGREDVGVVESSAGTLAHTPHHLDPPELSGGVQADLCKKNIRSCAEDAAAKSARTNMGLVLEVGGNDGG